MGVYSDMEDSEIYDLVRDLETVGLACVLSMYGVEDVRETTTATESKNGTRSFLDEQTLIPYKSHSNGYVRRTPGTIHRSRRYNSFYPINKRIEQTFVQEAFEFAGVKVTRREFTKNSCLFITNEEDRLRLIAKNIKKTRDKLPF